MIIFVFVISEIESKQSRNNAADETFNLTQNPNKKGSDLKRDAFRKILTAKRPRALDPVCAQHWPNKMLHIAQLTDEYDRS